MKILRAEIENFKPYEEVTLPHEGQLGEGLFLINGDNSMGKTSLIEAVLWGLLGDSLMDVKKKSMLVRTGATGCKVDIIFELGGSQFRIVRKMTIRKSRNPKSDVQFNSDAVLSKKEGTKFVPLFSGAVPVNREVEKLLGITAENIEKTVYVRQKEVDKLALADPKELRELVSGLFGLDEFDRVKANLSDKASNLQAEIAGLQFEVGSVPTERKELERAESSLKSKKSEFNKKSNELLKIVENLKHFPSESQLVSLRYGIEEVQKKESEILRARAQIDEKNDYIRTQNARVKQIKGEIKNFEKLRDSDIKHLRKIPSAEQLEKIQQIFNNIASHENSIKKLVGKSKIKPDFDPIVVPEQVSQSYLQFDDEVENLRKLKKECESKIDHVKSEITANKTLADLKKKSVNHVEDKGNCPVCKSIIKDTKAMIGLLTKESKEITTILESLESSNEKLKSELDKIDEEIKIKENYKDMLNKLQPLVEELIEERKKSNSAIATLAKKDSAYSIITLEIVNSLASKRVELETNLCSYNQNIASLNSNIKNENKTVEDYTKQLELLKKKEKQLTAEIEKINFDLLAILQKFSARDMKGFLAKFNCERLDELFAACKSLRELVKEKEESVDSLRKDTLSLEDEIKQRKARIEELSKKAEELERKSRELRHVKFLKGEIDGFISNYIVEDKLAEVLRHTTNSYLTPFTDGRYVIDKIYPTVRRTKGMESHGLEISLIDNKDNLPKFKEQLSGGDETALGLALRIAISKLMARIRPFKDSEIKPPLINSVMLDEPMASLDSSRRRNLVNILTQDQSFKQMFLITHTDMDFGDYNSIVVSDDESGKRNLAYNTVRL